LAIVATTLTTAITTPGQTFFGVASTTNITPPNNQTGAGITFLLVDQEYMAVTAVNTTTLVVTVLRGQFGTPAVTHLSGVLVQAGLPTDFSPITEFVGASLTVKQIEASLNWPATFLTGAADALTGASAGLFVVKTAGVDAITLATPLAAHEGNVIMIFSDTANAHTVTCPTTNYEVGAAAKKTVCTFPAFIGAGITLRVCNLNYHVMGTGASGSTNAGVVVWT
jgi:hypothetical protein